MAKLKEKIAVWIEGPPTIPKILLGLMIFYFKEFLAVISLILLFLWVLTAWHVSCGHVEIHPGIRIELSKSGGM